MIKVYTTVSTVKPTTLLPNQREDKPLHWLSSFGETQQELAGTSPRQGTQSTLPAPHLSVGSSCRRSSGIVWPLVQGTSFLASAPFPAQAARVGQGGSASAPKLSHPLSMCTLPIFLVLSGKVCQMKSYFSGLTKDKLPFLSLAMAMVGLRPQSRVNRWQSGGKPSSCPELEPRNQQRIKSLRAGEGSTVLEQNI